MSKNVLVVDVGGQHVKVLATGQTQPRRAESGPTMTAEQMVAAAKKLAGGWDYDVVSVGIPSPVAAGRVVHDPVNLGRGWAGFDYEGAFGKPTKVINDAAMQALGSYEGGRMLFVGLGTGLGSAMIIDGLVEPMELGHLPYKKKMTYEDFVGQRGLKRLGMKKWRQEVAKILDMFRNALRPEYIVLGGGNAKLVKDLPPDVRLGDNANAFTGGFRLWDESRGLGAQPPMEEDQPPST